MPDDPLDHPAIRNLLQEADAMRAVIDQLDGEDPGNFQATLDQIYTDLGRAVHALVAAPEKPARQEPASDLGARGVETARTSRRDAKRQRSQERRAVASRSQIPTATEDTPVPVPQLITSQGAVTQDVPGWNEPAATAEPWVAQLGDLLERIAIPSALDDPIELAAEASLVQWCTVDLDAQWAPFPTAIRAALLGLIASRARHLQDRLAVDVGPRIALERLSAYRERAGINKVEGLYPERGAQMASWAEDAQRWWESLVEGLRVA